MEGLAARIVGDEIRDRQIAALAAPGSVEAWTAAGFPAPSHAGEFARSLNDALIQKKLDEELVERVAAAMAWPGGALLDDHGYAIGSSPPTDSLQDAGYPRLRASAEPARRN